MSRAATKQETPLRAADVRLLQPLGTLGRIGDVVRVRNEFAVNFLVPRRKASPVAPEIRSGSAVEDEASFLTHDAAVAALRAEFEALLEEFPPEGLGQVGSLLEQARHGLLSADLLAGEELGPLVTLEEGRAAVAEMAAAETTTDWVESRLLGAADMARELSISTATLANWRADGHVVAFKRDRRNYWYPQRQVHRGSVISGLKEVVAHFDCPEDAWAWLVQPNLHTQGLPPIDRLRLGARDEVERAAEGALDYA